MATTWASRFGALFASLALLATFAATASAQGEQGGGGLSTAGVTVTAENPGTAPGSDLRLALTAHTEKSSVTNPDCRPPTPNRTPNLRCWGSLVLRVPESDPTAGGLTVTGFFEVHRVAVGDISCGDDESGGCGDEGAGCGDETGCGDQEIAATGPVEPEPLSAQVNGLAVVTAPGKAVDSGVTAGAVVQVKITLTDNGTARYGDMANVQVNEFAEGPSKPNLYTSGSQNIQQVEIRFRGNSGG